MTFGDRFWSEILRGEIIAIGQDDRVPRLHVLLISFEATQRVFIGVEGCEDCICLLALERLMGGRLTVQIDDLVSNFDRVTRHRHHPFNIVKALIAGVEKDDDLTPFGRISFNQGNGFGSNPVRKGQAKTVSELIDENMIPHEQRGNHGARGDLKRLDDTRADHKDEQ